MKLKQSRLSMLAGMCGILLPVVVFIFISLSLYYSPWFSWYENWLSELAGIAGESPIWAAYGLSSLLFNLGIILAGILGFIYAIVVRRIRILDSHLGRIGTLFLIVDMLALCAVGIFPLTTGLSHEISSLAFFILIPFSLIPIGISLQKIPDIIFGGLIVFLGYLSLFSFPLFFIPQPWGSNAIIEMIPIFSISAFSIILGIGLLKGKFDFKE